MKYVALIRGINVGGKGIIPMKKLQSAITNAGFTNVATYIQSGNVIFESEEKNKTNIANRMESVISSEFGCDTRVVVVSGKEMSNIAKNVPESWKNSQDIRKYIAFIIPGITIPEVKVDVVPREGVDELKFGEGVLYMSTILSGITKSGFARLMSKKVYKYLTIRNYNTVRKLDELVNTP